MLNCFHIYEKKRYNNFIIIWLWLDLKFRSFSFTHSFIHCLKFFYIKNQQHVFRLKFHFTIIWCECIFCLFDLWWSSYLFVCVCVVTFDIVDQDHHQCIHFCLQIISCFTWLNLLLLLLLKKNISKFILFIRFTVIVCLIKFFGFWFFFMQKKQTKFNIAPSSFQCERKICSSLSLLLMMMMMVLFCGHFQQFIMSKLFVVVVVVAAVVVNDDLRYEKKIGKNIIENKWKFHHHHHHYSNLKGAKVKIIMIMIKNDEWKKIFSPPKKKSKWK